MQNDRWLLINRYRMSQTLEEGNREPTRTKNSSPVSQEKNCINRNLFLSVSLPFTIVITFPSCDIGPFSWSIFILSNEFYSVWVHNTSEDTSEPLNVSLQISGVYRPAENMTSWFWSCLDRGTRERPFFLTLNTPLHRLPSPNTSEMRYQSIWSHSTCVHSTKSDLSSALMESSYSDYIWELEFI